MQSACRQVEFYFGDKNYFKDTYLTSLANKEENRWIDFSEIMQFNKMKVLTASLTLDEVIAALQKRAGPRCPFEMLHDGSMIRRKGLQVVKTLLEKKADDKASVQGKAQENDV